jgi:hypothetical protein
MNLKRYLIASVVSIAFTCGTAHTVVAQAMDVPVGIQIPLISKILTYDRNLPQRAGELVVVGIIYQSSFRESSTVKNQILKSVSDARLETLGGMPFKLETIDLERRDDLAGVLRSRNVTIVYVTPLRAYDIASILEPCRANKILTLTGVSGYTDDGIAVGIGIQYQKPKILINLASAKAEGADFDSHFLKLVRVLQ